MLFAKLDQLIFTMLVGGGQRLPTFFVYLAKEGRKWITTQVALKKPILHKWRNEIPFFTSPKWNIIWHKANAQKKVAFL